MKHILNKISITGEFSSEIADELFEKIEIEMKKMLTINNLVVVVAEAEIMLTK